MFDSVVAIQFLADCSSYDQNLREDPSKNRLLEALEIFEQTWRNRLVDFLSFGPKIVSEFDQEIPQSQTADKPVES